MNGIVLDDAAIILSETDTVATALSDLPAGREFEYEGKITLTEDISFGHKFALEPMSSGATVVKYGEDIGRASRDIVSGEWVHTHNCESTRGRGDLNAIDLRSEDDR